MQSKNGGSCLELVVTLSDIAVLSGYGERSVQRLTKSGLIKLARDDKGRPLRGRYVIGLTLPVLAEHTRDLATADDPHEQLYARSRARRMRCAAESAALDLKLKRAELLDGALVDREVMNVLNSVKNHVLGLPSRCTRQLAPYTGGGDNQKIVLSILTKETRGTLREASEFDTRKSCRKRDSAQRTSKHANDDDED